MGIFNFLKDVGQKLLEGHHSETSSSNETLAQKLEEQLQHLNLGIQNPKVRIDGDKAIIEGHTDTQDAYEKAVLAIGNTAGISQVDAQIQTPALTTPTFYTVKKGDTLSKIAKETLGDANRYPEIFEANKPMLKSPDQIYPGQQLRIQQAQKKAA